jgi:hypothetical protein
VGDPLAAIRRDVSGVKALLPLLHYALERRDDTEGTAPPLRHALAAAYTLETHRWQAYAEVCTRAFAALATARIPFLVLKGAALAVSAYPEPAIRHSHDIDVLVDAGDVDRAAAVVRSAGFAAPPEHRRTARSVRLVSERGVPIELHTRLFRLPYYGAVPRGVWDRAGRCEIAGAGVQMPSAADHFVHVCGQASCCASRDALKWIADAWFLAQDRSLDWSTVVRAAEESRLALPLAVLLGALVELLAMPVPPAVLERLCAVAANADRCAQEIALAGLRAGRRGRLRDLFGATSNWRDRVVLLQWMLAPSPTALRLGEPLRYPRAWPVYYLLRPSAYAVRRMRRREWFSSPPA